eukprot:CAMPEP_0115343248 /NCGR_PEP_ID=MMETSP0270-20121206/92639_1 /TAXON_ID=71861 /ORGANISM="Scrippsiella trochoidea, Strain CCMP3099" /LENGTH=109 /DNA_ID=CAMNT_0002764877 /DNA_START=394 /DNA_END=724 /DNA_ORIENTATION=-
MGGPIPRSSHSMSTTAPNRPSASGFAQAPRMSFSAQAPRKRRRSPVALRPAAAIKSSSSALSALRSASRSTPSNSAGHWLHVVLQSVGLFASKADADCHLQEEPAYWAS